MCLRVFRYQAKYIPVYASWLNALNIDSEKVNSSKDIPFLPIQFFKEQSIFNPNMIEQVTFRSSGTTGIETSAHQVAELSLYEESYLRCFEMQYGNVTDYIILGLLPSYLERQDSSLVYMTQGLIEKSGRSESGFFLNNYSDLSTLLENLKAKNEKVWLIGVSFALIDFSELKPPAWDNLIVVETGGMKGRKKEMIRLELHETIQNNWPVNKVHSEYGMTELLSQAWMGDFGKFSCPPWMTIRIREINDPFESGKVGVRGGINVIDLANMDSCSFIATQDLGIAWEDGLFDVIGRFDNSDIRGCNLLIQ
jgi:hypothetical protein